MKTQGRQDKTALVLDVPRYEQPDDLTCGPTCLAQLYHYHGYDRPLARVIAETPRNPDGGTQAVYLGSSALRNGFRARIYSYNLRVFDPTWYGLECDALREKLRQRRAQVRASKLRAMLDGYMEFLVLGGTVAFEELNGALLRRILRRGRPILTGLSATHLYRTPREYGDEYDDVRGDPVGHFVVISGYYAESNRFLICDPSSHIPFSDTGVYPVGTDRLIAAILLGDVTYDAVLLVLDPPAGAGP